MVPGRRKQREEEREEGNKEKKKIWKRIRKPTDKKKRERRRRPKAPPPPPLSLPPPDLEKKKVKVAFFLVYVAGREEGRRVEEGKRGREADWFCSEQSENHFHCLSANSFRRYLWTRSPRLYLKGDTDCGDNDGFCKLEVSYEDSADAFVAYANKTLVLCGGTPLKELGFEYMYEDNHKSHVDQWTHFAARNGTEKFELHFDYTRQGRYSLPQHLFHNSSFKELRFSYCVIVPSRPVSLQNLKKLSITDAYITGESLQKIIAGSPVLQILKVIDPIETSEPMHFHCGDSSVKKLVLQLSNALLEISAPNLESLKVSGSYQSFEIVNMSSLVEADLCGMELNEAAQYPILTQEDICSLSNAQTLIVGNCVMQGIEALRGKGVHLSLSKCKHLTIVTNISDEAPNAIAGMLKSFPGVETLIVTEFSDDERKRTRYNPPKSSNIINQYCTPQEVGSGLMHLRTVKFIGLWDYREHAFSLVRFLLENAKNLQKMIINWESKDSFWTVVPEELFEASQKLLSFPRSSPHAQLLVYK